MCLKLVFTNIFLCSYHRHPCFSVTHCQVSHLTWLYLRLYLKFETVKFVERYENGMRYHQSKTEFWNADLTIKVSLLRSKGKNCRWHNRNWCNLVQVWKTKPLFCIQIINNLMSSFFWVKLGRLLFLKHEGLGIFVQWLMYQRKQHMKSGFLKKIFPLI